MENINEKIRALSLQNAIKYNGKASTGSVIGALLAVHPDLKDKLSSLSKEIAKAVQEVNILTLEQQKEALVKVNPELLHQKKKEERPALPELPHAEKGKVVMRFEPSPSGPLHIGHAYVICLNEAYRKKYQGKFILRISDTNPENIYKPAYKMIPEEAQWLTKGKIDEVHRQSDRLQSYYDCFEKLINLEKAYVCVCDPEEYKKLLAANQPCPCRSLPASEQLKRWKKMLKGFKQGEAVGRLKTDLNDKNPAMRDFPLIRINEVSHPRTKKKFRVWPLMNLAVAVDDLEMGVTHTIRAKDHADNAKRQKIIHEYLGRNTPESLFLGRINFEDMPVSSSQTRKAIEEKKYDGWDDPRLPFIAAFQKRGYQPEAFLKYAVSVGMSLTDKTVKKEEFFKQLNHFNKEMIDEKSNRYFFVWDPVAIRVENAPNQSLELDLHPDKRKGGRVFKASNQFYITKEDLDAMNDGKIYRLMDCLNVVPKSKPKFSFHSLEYAVFKEKGEKIIHWLPKEKDLCKVEVVMPDATTVKGLGEPLLNTLDPGTIVQLERFGFCRLVEKKKSKLVFWFAHR